MSLAGFTDRGVIPALSRLVAFTQARHAVLVENIANADVPGYRSKRLDLEPFQKALGEAMERRDRRPDDGFTLRATRQFGSDADGRLTVEPAAEPPANVMFYDGTNGRIEQQMADLSKNAYVNRVAVELLHRKFNGLLKAIRGRSA